VADIDDSIRFLASARSPAGCHSWRLSRARRWIRPPVKYLTRRAVDTIYTSFDVTTPGTGDREPMLLREM
jgi:hypothetical protein